MTRKNTKDFDVSHLATAITWWLSYTNAIGRNYVLSEGAIKFPVSEYLERSNISVIELEYSHPKLLRKRFDLFFSKESDEEIAFEFKYIKNGSTRNQEEKQRVFDDLMRLYLFLDVNQKGYFLICGSQSDFVKDFQTILSKPESMDSNSFIVPRKKSSTRVVAPEGFYTEWFSFDTDKAEKEIDLTTTNSEYKNIYDTFYKENSDAYKKKSINDLELPSKITTKLVFLSGGNEQSLELLQPSKIGIWEVKK